MGFPGDRPGNEYDEAARFTLFVNRAAFRLPAHQPIVRFSRFVPVLGTFTVVGCEPEPQTLPSPRRSHRIRTFRPPITGCAP